MVKKKILIVEDNPINLELVTDLLEAADYAVSTAETAEDGIRLAGDILPDLILMDIRLPGIDGLQATQILRQGLKTMNIPVVAITAHAMASDQQRIMAAGCTGYISKPINTRTFLNSIDEYITIGTAL